MKISEFTVIDHEFATAWIDVPECRNKLIVEYDLPINDLPAHIGAIRWEAEADIPAVEYFVSNERKIRGLLDQAHLSQV